eukprot:TRINITY_DN6072_c0_g1_i1.p1 TRINITY_DN6072_c0_g1~~TRINITY_DN6072_c0_g1_i1.p1  ORF type:complete len:734 (+),score=183.30 TRINITY_DN6072_c0_g1_i1:56-2257(+)
MQSTNKEVQDSVQDFLIYGEEIPLHVQIWRWCTPERIKTVLTVLVLLISILLFAISVPEDPSNYVSLSENPVYFLLEPPYSRINIILHLLPTHFTTTLDDQDININDTMNFPNHNTSTTLSSTHSLETRSSRKGGSLKPTTNLFLFRIQTWDSRGLTWQTIRTLPLLVQPQEVTSTLTVDLTRVEQQNASRGGLRLEGQVNSTTGVMADLDFLRQTGFGRLQVGLAALILIGVYTIIFFETFHRTIAAMIGATVGIGVLSFMRRPPDYLEVISWIDVDTIGLLFGMMIMVGLFARSGFFEWSAVKAYKMSRGDVWKLTWLLCSFTAVASMVLDNVTTILLLTPVTIQLCRVLAIDPRPLLLAEVLFSNIGGTATPIGDPPNIIIFNAPVISNTGLVTFGNFTVHVGLGVVLALGAVYYYLVLTLKPQLDDKEETVTEVDVEIAIWRRAASQFSARPTDEEAKVRARLESYILQLEHENEKKKAERRKDSEERVENEREEEFSRLVQELEAKYVIRDKKLFAGSVAVLGSVITLFFLHSVLPGNLSLVWIAVIGSIVHIIVAGISEIEKILEKVEWDTLIFFACLFVMMKSLEELALISWIAEVTTSMISLAPVGSARLVVAICLLLWVSAVGSAFIDNIPFMTTLVPVVYRLSSSLSLPLQPLVWACVFGTCFGGNGTLLGASANVVCCGLAESAGYPISFSYFFRRGFPVMILSVGVANVYLLVAHVLISWH